MTKIAPDTTDLVLKIGYSYAEQLAILIPWLGNSLERVTIDADTPITINMQNQPIYANGIHLTIGHNITLSNSTIYAGGSVEILVNGYAKFRSPKSKTQMKDLFHQFRATVEGGFSYGNLGMFVQYGLTPIFPADLSDARTLTFGILLGL